VPTTTKPAKYSWLGGDLLPTELPSGVIAMGARSYVPQIGRFLQPDPIPGGSTNAYAYTNGNPVNETDLTGDYVENNYSASIFSAEDNEAIEQEAAREAAARAVAEREAQIAAAVAALQAKEAAEQAAINAQDRWDEEAAAGPSRKPGEVLYEAEGCTGTNACAAGILGFSVSLNLGEIGQWWQQVKGGWKLVKEVFEPALENNLRKNSTVCKAVGYAGAVGSYFIPESRFAKLIGLAVGLGTTYSC
jgi:RHS repeat-associated protein